MDDETFKETMIAGMADIKATLKARDKACTVCSAEFHKDIDDLTKKSEAHETAITTMTAQNSITGKAFGWIMMFIIGIAGVLAGKYW